MSNLDPAQHLMKAEWRNSNSVCALADGERHLGHVVRIGTRWHAFDATHFNEEGNSFRPLGKFVSLEAAKSAIEACCLRRAIADMSFAGAA